MRPEIPPDRNVEKSVLRRFIAAPTYFFIGFVNGAWLAREFVKDKYGTERFSRRTLFANIVAPALAGGIIGTVDGVVGIATDLLMPVPPKRD